MQRRRYQFTLAQCIRWVFIAAGLCMALRLGKVLWITGMAMLGVMLLWAFVAGAGVAGSMWGQFWDTRLGRCMLAGMLLLIAIPFSPLLLLCLDWKHLKQRYSHLEESRLAHRSE